MGNVSEVIGRLGIESLRSISHGKQKYTYHLSNKNEEKLHQMIKSICSKFLNIFLSYFHIYPTPPLGQDMTQGQFFKRSLLGLNSEFSFS